MPGEKLTIRTRDGECPTYVYTPESGTGPWPAVILFMDGLAIRPTLFEMAQRMANGGYVLLLPDMFYRAGPYAPMDPKEIFAGGPAREKLGTLFTSVNKTLAASDTVAFIDYIDSRADVRGKKIGVTGYCMGGAIALNVAAAFPDRIAAAASFHGGNLATDDADSPHRLAPQINGRVYVAAAVKDEHYPPEQHERLEKALTEAGVDHRCEFYEGALHGWTMPDTPIYDEAAAERHWRELFTLFGETLG